MTRYRSVRNGRRKVPTICPPQRENRKRAHTCGNPCGELPAPGTAGASVGDPSIGFTDIITHDGVVPTSVRCYINNVAFTVNTPYAAFADDTWTGTLADNPENTSEPVLIIMVIDGCPIVGSGIVS